MAILKVLRINLESGSFMDRRIDSLLKPTGAPKFTGLTAKTRALCVQRRSGVNALAEAIRAATGFGTRALRLRSRCRPRDEDWRKLEAAGPGTPASSGHEMGG